MAQQNPELQFTLEQLKDIVEKATLLCREANEQLVAQCSVFVEPKLNALSSLVALVLALSLTYLNLPNFRYSNRISETVRLHLRNLLSDKQKTTNWENIVKSDKQNAIALWRYGQLMTAPFSLGDPNEMVANSTPLTDIVPFGTRAFVKFFANDIEKRSLLSLDKILAAVAFGAAMCYLAYSVLLNIGGIVQGMTIFVLATVLTPVAIWSYVTWVQGAKKTVVAVVLVSLYVITFISIEWFRDNFGFIDLREELVACVLLLGATTMLVVLTVLSHLTFPKVEKFLEDRCMVAIQAANK
jgi:hypothetical protein